MFDDPGHVRSQIINVVCQIQWFDFDCNLVVMRKVIIRIPAGLDLDHLHYSCTRGFKPKPAGIRIITFRVTTRLQSKSNHCI